MTCEVIARQARALYGHEMTEAERRTELSVELLLNTKCLAVRDVVCRGGCRHRSPEECSTATHMVYPYRGVYVRHVGQSDAVAEANQVLFFNESESYQISHPLGGGDACISLALADSDLREIVPKEHARGSGAAVFNMHRLRIDSTTQALVARLRHGLARKITDTLEAETLALTLVHRTLGACAPRSTRASVGRQKLVDRAKLVLSSDPTRRWTLADIATEVGVSPVYLTQVFQQVEGMPLYRYQLRLRLARALDLLGYYEDLSRLSLDLGFSSHSHFTSTFRQTYGSTPADFQRSIRQR
jgi:AraC-like DNA-binding protein